MYSSLGICQSSGDEFPMTCGKSGASIQSMFLFTFRPAAATMYNGIVK